MTSVVVAPPQKHLYSSSYTFLDNSLVLKCLFSPQSPYPQLVKSSDRDKKGKIVAIHGYFFIMTVLIYSKYQVIKTCKMARFVNYIITTIFV